MTADVQFTLVSLVLNRVLERFPALKIVSAENDTGWLPHFMYRMDHAYEKYWNVAGMRPFEMKPSDFLRRNLRATFQDDPIGPATYDYFGADNYMWASDFPHSDSTWPKSREVVRTDFARCRRKSPARWFLTTPRNCMVLHLIDCGRTGTGKV